ncbi:MAG TPA: hypothetical protein VMV69_19670 [Pirellulales bacterium]|nr:hypothetical protein [Pirellulales bacterium]
MAADALDRDHLFWAWLFRWNSREVTLNSFALIARFLEKLLDAAKKQHRFQDHADCR